MLKRVKFYQRLRYLHRESIFRINSAVIGLSLGLLVSIHGRFGVFLTLYVGPLHTLLQLAQKFEARPCPFNMHKTLDFDNLTSTMPYEQTH